MITLISDVFPAPFGPITAVIEPSLEGEIDIAERRDAAEAETHAFEGERHRPLVTLGRAGQDARFGP